MRGVLGEGRPSDQLETATDVVGQIRLHGIAEDVIDHQNQELVAARDVGVKRPSPDRSESGL